MARGSALASLIGQRVKLTRSGREWKGLCPFHNEKTPSFVVYENHYHCFGCKAHGDTITWLRKCEGLSFAEAREQAGDPLPPRPPKRDRGTSNYASRLVAESQPITGTLAERYLRDIRGLGDLPLPTELRFHPAVWCRETGSKHPALLVICQDIDPRHCGEQCRRVQAVLLDPTTGDKAKLASPKLTFGQGFAHLPARFAAADSDATWTLLTEGPEDAIVLWAATGWRTDAALGSGSLDKPHYEAGTRLLISGDDTEEGHAKAEKAARAHRARGARVVLAFPPGDAKDANDLLRQSGPEAVAAWVQRAVSNTDKTDPVQTLYRLDAPEPPEPPAFRPCAPPRPLPTSTLVDASAYHAGTMLKFYKAPEDGEAPQIQMSGQGGTGKTEAAIRFTPEEPDRIAVLVPEHDVLGAELLTRYRAPGHDFEPLIGRGDPFNPQPDDLCIEPEAVAEARMADQDIAKTCCGTADGPHCRSFMVCPFQAAKARAAAAQKGFIGAHNHLFHPLPKDVAKDIKRLVIEEDFVQHGVWIFNLTHDSFGVAAIEQWPARRDGKRDDHQTQKLRWFGAALLKAGEQDGDLTQEAMRATGIRQDDFVEAIRIIRRRRVEIEMYPGMPIEARRAAREAGPINGQIGKLVTLIACASEIFDGTAPGRITSSTVITKRGTVRQFTVHTMLTVADWAREIPVVVNTATPQIDVMRQFFPRLEVRTPPEIATPFADNRLIVGGFAKTTVERSPRKRGEMSRFLKLEALGEIETSFVGFKGTKDEIADGVPDIIVQHHGQNAGGDKCRDVGVHTVQDGFRPRTRDTAALVRAKTGRSPSMAPPEEAIGRVLMTDGTGREGWSVLRYADADMQAEYDHIHNGSISQAVARSRSVRRTAINPVRNNVLGRVAPQDMVFTSVHRWKDVEPGRLGEMVIRRRVYLNAATMTAMHDDLFVTEKAASNARSTFGDIWNRLRGWTERDRRPWDRMRFKLSGQGHGWQWAVYPAADEADVFFEIEAKLGPIAGWEIERFTEGRPPHPQPMPSEDIPETVQEVVAEPGMSSPVEPVWRPGSSAEHSHRMEQPPDG